MHRLASIRIQLDQELFTILSANIMCTGTVYAFLT
jgi:hypothetical protein